MSETSRPEIVEWIAAHGGIARVHVTPFTDGSGKRVGWQNVIVCMDGVRRGTSPAEGDEIIAHSEFLYAVKRRYRATHPEG